MDVQPFPYCSERIDHVQNVSQSQNASISILYLCFVTLLIRSRCWRPTIQGRAPSARTLCEIPWELSQHSPVPTLNSRHSIALGPAVPNSMVYHECAPIVHRKMHWPQSMANNTMQRWNRCDCTMTLIFRWSPAQWQSNSTQWNPKVWKISWQRIHNAVLCANIVAISLWCVESRMIELQIGWVQGCAAIGPLFPSMQWICSRENRNTPCDCWHKPVDEKFEFWCLSVYFFFLRKCTSVFVNSSEFAICLTSANTLSPVRCSTFDGK